MTHVSMTETKKAMIVLVTLLSMLISGFAIDIYTPSLPAVTAYFGVDKAQVQLTITTYLIGYGLSQLYAGSISDSFGRKNPLMIAFFLFGVISLLIPYSQTINELQFLRFFQGMTVGFVNVPGRAIVADLYEGPAFYRVINYLTIAWAIGPIIAPAIGGYLQHYIGWYASFYFLGIYSAIVFGLNLMLLTETIIIKHQFNHKELVVWYWRLLKDKNYLLGLICLGLLYSMLVLFGVVAPFLIQDVLHYSAVQFGHMALLTGFAWFLGNITNRFLANYRILLKVRLSLLAMLFAVIMMFLMALKDAININDIVIPTIVIFYFGGLIFPNYFAQNIALYRHVAGYANGLMGGVVVFIAGLGGALGVILKSTTQIPLTAAFLGIIIFCLFSSFTIKHQELDSKK